MSKHVKAIVGGIGLLGSALSAVSCSGGELGNDEPPAEATSSSEAALDVASCASVAADGTLNGGGFLFTPQSYNTCDKGFVTDLSNLSAGQGGGYARAVWWESTPTNQAECEDTEGRAVFYKSNGAQWVPVTGEERVVGRWVQGPAPTCEAPKLFYGPLQAGASYRIAASTRRISGENPTRTMMVSVTTPFISLSAGGTMCATLFEGTKVRCWGQGSIFSYGNRTVIGDDDFPSSAGDVDIGGPVSQVAVGSGHACALLKSGAVRCWGQAANGGIAFGVLGYANANEIGDDETPASAGDVNVGGTVTQVALGTFHTCALMSTGAVRCWGSNLHGQLGNSSFNTSTLDDNVIGDNETPADARPLGSSNAADLPLGTDNGQTRRAVQIVAGQEHTCILLSTGKVMCWGLNDVGQLGYGNTSNIGDNEGPSGASPQTNAIARIIGPTETTLRVVKLAAGDKHTCALLNNSKVRCWGRGGSGQLGYGNTSMPGKQNIGDNEDPFTAGDVNVGGAVSQIAAGGDRTCAILSDGRLVCWGRFGASAYAGSAHIGDNETPAAWVATNGAVNMGPGMTTRQVAMTQFDMCALLGNGTVKCWGNNNQGMLGLGISGVGSSRGGPPVNLPNVQLWGGCADETAEQLFAGDHAVGCAGSAIFADRQTLCQKGWSVCSANQWVTQRTSGVPSHSYWTNDNNLGFGGNGSGACSASTSGFGCGEETPMRICSGATDPEGNQCNIFDCGLEGTSPNQFFGGCWNNNTAGSMCCQGASPVDGCADGSAEQVFPGGAVGCAGSVSFSSRNSLCASGWKACTATEWVTRRDGIAPTHHYWTDDTLNVGGSDTGSCFASTTGGFSCGLDAPMRVCAEGFNDTEGNECNWWNCGLNGNAPNDHFGGCVGNISAGTLCCPL